VQYPWVSRSAIASWKIFLVTFVLAHFALQIGVFWGNFYPTASQRGEKPQAANYRHLLVTPFDFHSGGLRTNTDAELYALAFVDDYAFKRTLFRSRSAF
jgi:hypothetical protein